MTTEEKLRDMLANTFGVRREAIMAESRINDLGLDSLPAIALLHELETEFDITLPRSLDFKTTVQSLSEDIDGLKRANR